MAQVDEMKIMRGRRGLAAQIWMTLRTASRTGPEISSGVPQLALQALKMVSSTLGT